MVVRYDIALLIVSLSVMLVISLLVFNASIVAGSTTSYLDNHVAWNSFNFVCRSYPWGISISPSSGGIPPYALWLETVLVWQAEKAASPKWSVGESTEHVLLCSQWAEA